MGNTCTNCQKDTNLPRIEKQLHSPKIGTRQMVESKMKKYNLTKRDFLCYDCIWLENVKRKEVKLQ